MNKVEKAILTAKLKLFGAIGALWICVGFYDWRLVCILLPLWIIYILSSFLTK